MPKAYPNYPYVEPLAAKVTDAEIQQIIDDLLDQTPKLSLPDAGTPDRICKAVNVDVEYSGPVNEIRLDVPPRGKAVIWLPKKGKPRQDRMAAATGLGHWLLHILKTREAAPGRGIQALHNPTNGAALAEAVRFAHAFLMPADAFKALWYEGRAALTADVLNVPTQAVYDRAKALLLVDKPQSQGAITPV